MKEEQIKEIKVETVTSENHMTFLSNRIWGGLKLGGLFEINFLLETTPIPETLTMEVNPDGSEKEARHQSDVLIRTNQATAYLTIETLLSLRDWLDGKVKEFEEQGMIQKVDKSFNVIEQNE